MISPATKTHLAKQPFAAVADTSQPTMHVDDFIVDRRTDAYAAWVLDHFRRPALQRLRFDAFMKVHKLFCTFNEKRFRVTGASRMGDVWLAADFNEDTRYDLRVDVAKCTAWGANP